MRTVKVVASKAAVYGFLILFLTLIGTLVARTHQETPKVDTKVSSKS